MTGMDARDRLRERIRATKHTGAVYPLSGGGASDVYWDVRAALMKPGAMADAVRVVLAATPFASFMHYTPRVVAGMGVGGTLLVGGICALRRGMSGLVVRPEGKQHGLQRRVEGELDSWTVVLVDDVVTTGASLASMVEPLCRMGAQPVMGAVALLDRSDGAAERLFEQGVVLESVFTAADV